jgi:SAM-dependent methyltransferase
MHLSDSNLFYRQPALYDQVQADPDDAATKLCEELVDSYGPDNARTLVDFGCGTGQNLERLAQRFGCVGVDLQPSMVEYARAVRVGLDIRIGDVRSFRLGHKVDVITCLGNTPSYLHKNTDLQRAFATFAEHARPGTLLILHTPVAPVQADQTRPGRVDTADLHADVAIHYDWDLRSQINTMHRHWKLDDGTEHHDEIRRRVLFPQELEQYLTSAGFDLVDLFDRLDNREGKLSGPSAYVVARFRGRCPGSCWT